MRFLFIAPWYHTNQHFAANALLASGHEVVFLVHRKSAHYTYDEHHPTIDLLAGKRPGNDFIDEGVPSFVGLWHQIKEWKPDVVVVRNPAHATGALSALVAKLTGATVILYNLLPIHRRASWRRIPAQLFAQTLGARWITPILGERNLYPPTFPALRYLPFPMEPQTTTEQKQWFRNGAVNLLTVSSFQPRKNHRLLLEAIAALSGKYPVRATLIGECTTDEHRRVFAEIREFQASVGLDYKVQIKTNMPFGDVQQEYSLHDLFVLPARDEPAGIALLEAMSHSLPAVCSESCGLKSSIRPGENGYVFRTDDADDLKKCIESIIRDRGRLVEMGTRSYEIVTTEHSPVKYVERLVSIAKGND